MNYRTYLNSKQWKKLRQSARFRAGNQCEMCKEGGAEHVHHIRYPKRFKDDHIDNLVVVCKNCHEKLHGIRKTMDFEEQPVDLELGKWLNLGNNFTIKAYITKDENQSPWFPETEIVKIFNTGRHKSHLRGKSTGEVHLTASRLLIKLNPKYKTVSQIGTETLNLIALKGFTAAMATITAIDSPIDCPIAEACLTEINNMLESVLKYGVYPPPTQNSLIPNINQLTPANNNIAILQQIIETAKISLEHEQRLNEHEMKFITHDEKLVQQENKIEYLTTKVEQLPEEKHNTVEGFLREKKLKPSVKVGNESLSMYFGRKCGEYFKKLKTDNLYNGLLPEKLAKGGHLVNQWPIKEVLSPVYDELRNQHREELHSFIDYSAIVRSAEAKIGKKLSINADNELDLSIYRDKLTDQQLQFLSKYEPHIVDYLKRRK